MADLILLLHFAYILAVVLPLGLIPIGACRGWRWVRSRKLRIIHLGMMGFVVVEAVAGIVCPLTWLENALRGTNTESFVAHWVGRIVFYDFSPLFFTVIYLTFFGSILALWLLVPPHAGRKKQPKTRRQL